MGLCYIQSPEWLSLLRRAGPVEVIFDASNEFILLVVGIPPQGLCYLLQFARSLPFQHALELPRYRWLAPCLLPLLVLRFFLLLLRLVLPNFTDLEFTASRLG